MKDCNGVPVKVNDYVMLMTCKGDDLTYAAIASIDKGIATVKYKNGVISSLDFFPVHIRKLEPEELV